MELKEVLRKIETGEPFSLEWVTLSVSKGTGGQIRSESNLRLLVQKEDKIPGMKPKPTYSHENSCQYIKLWNEATGRHITVYKRLMLKMNGIEITY
jgi:hypothetical protein